MIRRALFVGYGLIALTAGWLAFQQASLARGDLYESGWWLHHSTYNQIPEDGLVKIDINGERYVQPVTTIQTALTVLGHGDIEGAERIARALLETSTSDETGRWFLYEFDFQSWEDPATAPWRSALAQGQAVSLFVRLHRATGDDVWLGTAESTAATLDDPRIWRQDDAGRWWFVEYETPDPGWVVNGHISASWGLVDWLSVTEDPKYAQMWSDAVRTTRWALAQIDLDAGTSLYCIRGCGAHPNYFETHVWQAKEMAKLTGDDEFRTLADALES